MLVVVVEVVKEKNEEMLTLRKWSAKKWRARGGPGKWEDDEKNGEG